MSRVFKRPKPILSMGSPRARMIKYARTIKTEAELRFILQQVSKQTALGFMDAVLDHLPFKIDLSSLDNLNYPDLQHDESSA